MKRDVIGAVLLVAAVLSPATAWAQGNEEQSWGPGTTLSLFGGAASSDSRISGVASGSIGWEFTRGFAIEGNGTWMSNGGFAALLGPRVAIPLRRTVVPTLYFGVGMWVESRQEPLENISVEKTFEEFAYAAGVGTDFFLSQHLAIRPDVRVMFIYNATETRVMPVFGLHVTYHFDSHPYLP
jgi:hypothetical protein